MRMTRPTRLSAPATALVLTATLLLSACSHPSPTPKAAKVAQAVADWNRSFVTTSGNSCANLTDDGQKQLQIAAGATTCEQAAAKLLTLFTDQDKEGFTHVSVDPAKIRLTDENHAQIPAGDVTYKPRPSAFLRLDGPLTLTRVDGKWRLDSVVFVAEH
jgi:hypothetical protein